MREKIIEEMDLAVLNCYRNKYYADGNSTEQGIIANAINDILPILVSVKNGDYRKQEWTSVEERLPSEEEYRDEYGELIPILVCEKDTQYPYRAMYDGTEWGDGLMKIRGITHWMPLPEPPKMKGGEE